MANFMKDGGATAPYSDMAVPHAGLYFDKVTELALNEPDSVLFKEAL
ncbi:hypothetical protein A2U01_0068610, partial [Trifolium medium]|nr:hypothetical protein [Trifolium medium]